MKHAPGRRFALMMMGVCMTAGAAGLAGLPDGMARVGEPSPWLIPDRDEMLAATAHVATIAGESCRKAFSDRFASERSVGWS